MNQQIKNTSVEQISQQELHHLITVATGFIDAYIIECHDKAPMLLPQNIVLSALDSSTKVQTVEWHEHQLPVFAVHHPSQTTGVALVIEGDDIKQRFALLCNEMPKSIRVRISEVVDYQQENLDPTIFQYVKMQDKIFYVPNLIAIQQQLGL